MTRPFRRTLISYVLFAFALVFASAPAAAQTPAHVTLYAAGSLKAPLTEISALFAQQTGVVVDTTYGSSGLLRTQIENGAKPDLFASADTASPRRLQAEGKSGDVTVFARNRMCLLVKPPVAGSNNVADIMLDPAVRLITSTPAADPAGDYAEHVFAKIDATRPGSKALLDAKALRLVGGPNAVSIPPGADLPAYLLLDADDGDAFLAYCSGFMAATAHDPARLRSLEMPPALAIQADYGLTLRDDAPPAALRFAQFMLSDRAQSIFEKYGFSRI